MFRIFCDFDGTITTRDSIVFLTDRLGGGTSYRAGVFERIKSGELSVFDAIAQELATVRASWEEAEALLREHIDIEPTFEAFVRWCRYQGHPVSVVSSGLKPVVSMFVGHLNLPIHAHPVECRPDGWRYRRDPSQEKTSILSAVPDDGSEIVYIGDGSSDVAVLPWVDRLFAKDYLAEYCRRHDFPFTPFSSFRDVADGLAESG